MVICDFWVCWDFGFGFGFVIVDFYIFGVKDWALRCWVQRHGITSSGMFLH